MTIRHGALFALLLASQLVLPGCTSRGEDQLVGVWIADTKASIVPPIAIPGIEQKVKVFLNASLLKIRSDHTFVLATDPRSTVEGKWTVEGKSITIRPSKGKLMGPLGALGDEMKGEILSDYSKIRIVQPTPVGDITLVLKKSA